jgi:hypothetical protein
MSPRDAQLGGLLSRGHAARALCALDCRMTSVDRAGSSLIVCLVLLATGSWAASGSAQTLDATVLAPRAAALASFRAQPAALAVQPTPVASSSDPSREQVKSVDRARWLIATGAGVITGSAGGLALAGRARYCEYQDLSLDRTAPRALGASFGVIGLGITSAGTIALLRTSEALRAAVPAHRRKQAALFGGALSLAIVSASLVALSALPQNMRCWHS